MLTIKRVNQQQVTVTLDDLFQWFGITKNASPTDNDGETLLPITGSDIEVKAPNVTGHPDTFRWPRIEALRLTKPEHVSRLNVAQACLGGQHRYNHLDASPDHLVLAIKNSQISQLKAGAFHKIKNLNAGDRVIVDHLPLWCPGIGMHAYAGSPALTVTNVQQLNCKERLYDLQVEDVVEDLKRRVPSLADSVMDIVDDDVFKYHTIVPQRVKHAYYTNGIASHNSHFLVDIGAHALTIGKNVVHYTFELSETAIGQRYDSNLTGIPSNDVIQHRDEVLQLEDSMDLGKLVIKSYPTGTATIQTIRSHVERLALKNMKPDVIIIDYADIMRSTRRYDAPRFELKLIYEELRNLAMDLSVPVWTASQAHRDSANSDVVGLENMSEAYGKAMVADVVLSLSRKPAEKATGMGRLFVAKNRAGRDGVTFPIKIDTATSKITVLDGEMSLKAAASQDEADMKNALRAKWSELRRDRDIASKPLTVGPTNA